MDDIVNNVINNIAEKLGITVDYVVPALARYYIAECLIHFIAAIITFILCYLIVKATKMILDILKKSNEDEKMSNYDYNSSKSLTIIIGSILFGVALMAGLICLFSSLSIVKWIMAPEGATIAYILDKIKS